MLDILFFYKIKQPFKTINKIASLKKNLMFLTVKRNHIYSKIQTFQKFAH